MNATEAKTISLINADKVARRQFEEAIKEMEKEIEKNAKEGYFGASIRVARSSQWKKLSLSGDFFSHFFHKGFDVDIRTFSSNDDIVQFICRW